MPDSAYSLQPRLHGALPSLLGALLLVSFAIDTASAYDLHASLYFDRHDLRLQHSDDGTAVAMTGLSSYGDISDPSLPVALRTFAIPEGFEVSEVRVRPHGTLRTAESVRLAPRKMRQAAAAPAEGLIANDPGESWPLQALDINAARFPAADGVSLGAGTMAGHRVHTVAVFPVHWDRRSGDLLFTESVDIELSLRSAPTNTSDLRRERINPNGERAWRNAIASMVVNPHDMTPIAESQDEAMSSQGEGFAPTDVPSTEGSAVDYVIVTEEALAASFQPMVDWKTKKGVPTVVRTVEWIDQNYPGGHDRPERIREFLRDAYSKWGTYLALFGGDFQNVPPRLAYSRVHPAPDGSMIPTDQYYACLEGDWNGDGDHLYGEGTYQSLPGDNCDFFPDMFVGRAPVGNVQEASAYVSKTLFYEKSPAVGYVEDVCYLAEVLFPSYWEFGDDPDDINMDGADLTDGFDAFVPPSWTRTKRYQSENNQDREIGLQELNFGHHLQMIMGHGDAFRFSCGNGADPLINAADVDTLTNGPRYSFIMATACNPNQYDLECMGESFLLNPLGGAFAVIGPTREDYPQTSSSYHRSFLDLIFNNGVTQLGAANQLHRVPHLGNTASENTTRWTFLVKLLVGDPELSLWVQEPESIAVSHAGSIPFGSSSIPINVTSGGSPLADATVCVSDSNGTYSVARTNSSGDATLPITSWAPGTVDVVVSKPDAGAYLPIESTFSLGTAGGPALALRSFVIDDDNNGASSGNGDGVLDAGETIELLVTGRNGGSVPANDASVGASVEAGSSATFDLLWNGVADVNHVFVGADAVNPATLPFTLDFLSPSLDFFGRPAVTVSPDSTSDIGIFLWQDIDGWHLEWGSGGATVPVSGTITTDGRVRRASSLSMESATDSYSISGGETTLSFSASTSDNDRIDRLDFTLADDTMVTVTGGSASLGTIAAGSTASGTVTFTVSPLARNGRVAEIDLGFAATNGGPWKTVAPIDFAAPALEAWVHAIDDSNSPPVSGDGDGIPEVGETVRLTPMVLNDGSGTASGVDGSASATAGITFVDAADSYGDLDRLEQSNGSDGYVFTINDVNGTDIDLVLTDSVGRQWVKNIEFVPPAAPINLSFASTESQIEVVWEPTEDADLAGYNVYRSATEGSGHVRVNEHLLDSGARFLDAGLSIGAIYFYQVTAVDESGNEGPRSAEVKTWTTVPQVAGWPQLAGGNAVSSILLSDVNADGTLELFGGVKDFRMRAFNSNGTNLEGWPITTGGEVWGTPAAGDLDGDGDLEILWGSNDKFLYAAHHDGTPVFGSDHRFFEVDITNARIRSAVTIADIDADSHLEFMFGTDEGQLYAFNHDGTPLAGTVGGLLYQAPEPVSGNLLNSIWGTIAVADMDLDGDIEIAFACWNNFLYVIDPSGADVPGFPKESTLRFQFGPSIGDLDNDGDLEVVAASDDGGLYAFHHDGSPVVGSGVLATLPDWIRQVPTLCNLDADPELEIVVSCFDGKLYAFNHNGSGFQNPDGFLADVDVTAAITASPIVVDIDEDDDFEIFVSSQGGGFHGFHHDGAPIVGLPIVTAENAFATGMAGDIDNDGDVDIAFASFDQSINVIDFSGLSRSRSYEWAGLGASQFRTSVYGGSSYQVGINPGLGGPVALNLSQNRPNPFASGTTIRYFLPQKTDVSLRVYDVSGRLVRTLAQGAAPAGDHSAQWDGNDSGGRRLSSGVYFYRLQSGDEIISRKSMLLR